MATRAVAVAEQPRGGGKLNNGQGLGKRRALGDIGNLVTAPVAVDGKLHKQINRPITRSSCAQLMAKAQAPGPAENNNNKKPLSVIVNGVVPKRIATKKEVGAVKPAAVQKKPQKVIVISSDEEDKTKEEKPRNSKVGSGKEAKTLTSVLTARSQAACRLTTSRPKEAVADIDAVDACNELAVVEYVEDIYKFYKQTEGEGRVQDYIDSQPEINAKMRSILMDWLVEVHRKFELMPETLYLTINIVDRFLSMKTVSRRELQLVGISALLIACKYEEIWAPEVTDLIAISDNAYVREQILVMEKAILGKLEWYLTVPTPYLFLVRYIKAASVPVLDQEMEKMSIFVAELGLMHYATVIHFSPSMLAAAAVYTARCTLNKSPSWTETLKHYTGYSEDQLKDCAKMLAGFHSEAVGSKLTAVFRKFSSLDRSAVALIPPAKLLLDVGPLRP